MKDSFTPGAGQIYRTTQNSKIIFDKETCSFDLTLTKTNTGCQMAVSVSWPSMADESLRYDAHIAGYTTDNNLKGTNTSIIDKSRYSDFNPHAPDRFTPSRARCVKNCGSALNHR